MVRSKIWSGFQSKCLRQTCLAKSEQEEEYNAVLKKSGCLLVMEGARYTSGTMYVYFLRLGCAMQPRLISNLTTLVSGS